MIFTVFEKFFFYVIIFAEECQAGAEVYKLFVKIFITYCIIK